MKNSSKSQKLTSDSHMQSDFSLRKMAQADPQSTGAGSVSPDSHFTFQKPALSGKDDRKSSSKSKSRE